jgi:seryl-tRNA synthetase
MRKAAISGGATGAMHDIKWIRENQEAFDAAMARRGLPVMSVELLALDEHRRAAIAKLETAQARRNAASKEIGQAKAKKDEARAQELLAEVATLKDTIPALAADESRASWKLDTRLAEIPNMPLAEVPDGKDEHDNVEHHTFGAKRDYGFAPKQHFELGETLAGMDFETAAKLSGARFVVLKGALARLERALGQFMLNLHTQEHGYTEISPPLMVRDDVMFGTAQLPKFADDQFAAGRRMSDHEVNELALQVGTEGGIRFAGIDLMASSEEDKAAQRAALFHEGVERILRTVEDQKFWLIPTAEVPLTNLVRESIVDENALPLRFTACTPCFRAEAGAAGRDTRGMIRQHQFTKVELVSITTPEQSKDEQERMLACAEEVLRQLDLHYRVVTLCAGDMGFAAQKTYDIEVWLPGQGAYREISSCSTCGDFQARRMQARYRGKDGKVKGLVHTLNGSGVAVGRALIAILETYQQQDGAIAVPDVLQPYMGGMTRIEYA